MSILFFVMSCLGFICLAFSFFSSVIDLVLYKGVDSNTNKYGVDIQTDEDIVYSKIYKKLVIITTIASVISAISVVAYYYHEARIKYQAFHENQKLVESLEDLSKDCDQDDFIVHFYNNVKSYDTFKYISNKNSTKK